MTRKMCGRCCCIYTDLDLVECNDCGCRRWFSEKKCMQCNCSHFWGDKNYCTNDCRLLDAKKKQLVRLLKTFGMTTEEYEALMIKQDNRCAICHQPEKETKNGNLKRLAIDHCHITGKVRGLLCQRCNTGIGFFNDNWVLIENALEYLMAADLQFGISQRMGSRNVNA